MKTTYLQLVCLFLLVTVIPVSANTTPWGAASEQLTASTKLPAKITMTEEIFNRDQDLEGTTTIEAILVRTVDDTIRFVVTGGNENYKPIPLKNLQELDKILSKDDEGPLIPFRSQDQVNLTWHTMIEFDDIDGKACQAYSFTGDIKDQSYSGKVWLERSSGLPLRVHWQNNSVPFKEDGVIIHSRHQVDHYKITENGNSYPFISEMNSQVELDSSFASFEGRIRSVFTFHDYQTRTDL